MPQQNGEGLGWSVYPGKTTKVIWTKDVGKLVLKTEDESREILESHMEHQHTAGEFKMRIGRRVKLLVEGGKITSIKPA
jgi:hypothetical protein